jgi:hypothetical protein
MNKHIFGLDYFFSYINTLIMPLITRTVSKGIPPRLRSPAGKSKKKATAGKRKQKRKRDDHDEDSEISKAKRRKRKRREPSTSSESDASDEEESGVEVVEDREPVPAEIVVVDDGELSVGDEEVRFKILLPYNENFYLQYFRETGSTNINEAKTLKQSLSKKS